MWRFFRCLSSCSTSFNSLEKIFSCNTACTLGNLEHSLMSCLLICIRVCRGISARGRSVENMILLIGNLLADSLIRLQNSEIKTWIEVVAVKSFVPVWIKIISGISWRSFWRMDRAFSSLGHLKNVSSWFGRKSFFLSRNLPFESHKKAAVFDFTVLGGCGW